MDHRNEHSVEIERPPDAVFPYLVDPDKRLRWMRMLSEARQVGEGPPGLGTRFADVFDVPGRRLDVEAEIVTWEPDRRLATRIRSNGFTSTASQVLEDLGGRTRLTATLETDYTNRVVRMMGGVVTRHAQQQLEADLATLKELVETET